jgi:prepilin-type N-terminal cleavage/methylation domain-containing protein
MDSDTTMNKEFHKHDRSRLAFTLIEMLMVITIMGIVATLVVTMGQAASQKKKIVAVEGEKQKIITMIGNYYSKLNYYPPDNANLASVLANKPAQYDATAATNPLLYELTGGTNYGGSTMAVFNCSNLVVGTTNTLNTYAGTFMLTGVANGDPLEPHNFFQPGPAAKECGPYATNGQGKVIYGLIVPTELVPGNTNNFWHYDSSTTNRHNMNSYDLWAEFSVGNIHGQLKTITNGNW